MKPVKKYIWATIEANSKEDLEKTCKERYPGHIIINKSIIKSQYDKEFKYKQVFILRKINNHGE